MARPPKRPLDPSELPVLTERPEEELPVLTETLETEAGDAPAPKPARSAPPAAAKPAARAAAPAAAARPGPAAPRPAPRPAAPPEATQKGEPPAPGAEPAKAAMPDAPNIEALTLDQWTLIADALTPKIDKMLRDKFTENLAAVWVKTWSEIRAELPEMVRAELFKYAARQKK